MEMLKILARESENTPQVYLYEEEEGHWYAYEHSAFLMAQLLKGLIQVKQVICDLYGIILNKVEIDFSYLISYPITLCSDSEIVVALPGTLEGRGLCG